MPLSELRHLIHYIGLLTQEYYSPQTAMILRNGVLALLDAFRKIFGKFTFKLYSKYI